MIEEITIQNLGVIKEATIQPSEKMTVITGETGAGKTMLLTSIKMLLGSKTDSKIIRQGSEESYVEAIFNTHNNTQVLQTIKENEYDFDSEELIFGRKISVNKKSRAYINGKTIPSAALQNIGSKLVTIHGQQDQIRLKNSAAWRQAIDEYGDEKHKEKLTEYFQAYTRIKTLQTEYKKIQSQAQNMSVEHEIYGAIIKKYDELQIQPNEDEILRKKIQDSSNNAQINQNLKHITNLLSNEDSSKGALELIYESKSILDSINLDDDEIKKLNAQINNIYIEIKDLASNINTYLADIEYDPEEIEKYNTRYNRIRQLMKNRATTTEELTQWVETIREKYDTYENIDTKLEDLVNEIKTQRTILDEKGKTLEESRMKLGEEFSSKVTKELHLLNMKDAVFKVEFIPHPKPTQYGLNDLIMTFTSHPNLQAMPISDGASGGELSRIMLAIEVVLAEKLQTGNQTFIFDEIDAGIGGQAALQVGNRLKELSKTHQIIVVTHLPQVAAYGDIHYKVGKKFDITSVKEIKSDERVIELARMLSGQEDLEAAKIHAEELLRSLS